MTAKELHDLYYPLWVKVPETRPPLGTYSLHEAAALARVAVEDWLRARTAITLDHTPGVKMPTNATGKPTAVCPIDHALVAAALAVAGEVKK